MKMKHLLFATSLGLMLGACSNDEFGVTDPGQNAEQGTAVADAGYVALNINLPSTSGSKGENQYEDGMVNEYEVKNAALFVFELADGAAEEDAVYLKSYNMADLKPWQNVGGNVTTQAAMVQEVPAKQNGGTRYALVVLNDNGVLKNVAGSEATINDQKIKNFGDFKEALGLTANLRNDGFFMSNTPLRVEKDGAVSVVTLVKIEDNIRSTKEAARQVPAAKIYVERALAKVTLPSNTNVQKEVSAEDGSEYANDHVQILAWGLDVTNKTTKLVRDVTGFDTWSAYQSQTGGLGGARFWNNDQRILWAVDGNYDNDKDDAIWASSFNTLANADLVEGSQNEMVSDKFGEESPLYCFENTGLVSNMRDDRNTRVIFKAVYTPANADADGSFYMIGNSAKIYTLDGVKGMVSEAIMKSPSINKEEIGLFNATDNNLQVTLNFSDGGVYHMVNAGFVTSITFKAYKVDGQYVKKDTYEDPENQDKNRETEDVILADTHYSAIDNYFGEKGIQYYKEGESYYAAYIKHFGDVNPKETPWGGQDEEQENVYGNPVDEASYLGRYGVVRNTWYELTVSSISSPGSPNVPDLDDDYIDKNKYYIAVEVNILSWAKRNQNVDL